MSSGLDSTQNDWVETKVKEGFELSEETNSVLFGKSGVPAMPKREEIICLAQATLTREQVNFMLDDAKGKKSVFSYQTKLVSPSDRIDLLKELLDSQSKTMGTSDQRHQDVWIWEPVEEYLVGCPSRVVAPTWYWEFGQGDQIIKGPQRYYPKLHRPSFALIDRKAELLKTLPAGMRGTDRFTWATRMASGSREGRPLDLRFPNNATDTTITEQWNFTVLDEEGEFSIKRELPVLAAGGKVTRELMKKFRKKRWKYQERDEYRGFVSGGFEPHDRRVRVASISVGYQREHGQFRFAVDGPTRP